MSKKKVAILFGGTSPEHPISLQSAYAVITHIDTHKYEPVLIGISQQGEWLLFRGDPVFIVSDTWQQDEYCTEIRLSFATKQKGLIETGKNGEEFIGLAAAFPVMHGSPGEDGTIQGLFELAEIPVVGCGSLSSTLCVDKDVAHRLVASIGISVPKSRLFTDHRSFADICLAAQVIDYPLFVKPTKMGSSIGISMVTSAKELKDAVELAFNYDPSIVLEEAIEGFEVGCSILGNDDLIVGDLDEIELANGFFDYEEKYSLATSRIHVPARVSPRTTRAIKEAAQKIYKLLRCSGFARIDFFVSSDGGIIFNEVNTVPGLTTHSRYPTMMKAVGLDFSSVINGLIDLAVE
ncbi:MAG: D-alanine--D-alanine ligase [Coriobacteriales bacterium]|jgi:D-alanine---D-serine ligase|nr:D-alanine--D-alanine ligase [Coriobacteriales bacterium]